MVSEEDIASSGSLAFKMRGLLICFVFLLVHNITEGIDPLVHTKVGLIKGLRATDGDYSMFMGIPFGKVDPANPFGISTPYPSFENTFEAYDDSAICPQLEEINNTVTGTIDCLHLNVYVPTSAHSKNLLPVLVWIYGGGFSIGFAGRTLYGPKYLVRHDIILVTVNYRLGPYGFMCLDTPEVPGNQGLKDQLLGLRWIKDNIEAFGGDVNQITIFGESAGGISVDYHLYSEHENLFKAAILQSGNALMPVLRQEADQTIPIILAEKLGFITTDMNEALSFLATVDPKLVIAASVDINTFSPCVEKDFENVERFITEHPVNSNIPKVKGMPILIGFNSHERIANYDKKSLEYYEKYSVGEKMARGFNFNEEDFIKLEEIVKHFYIGDKKISDEVRAELSELDSDVSYNYPADRSVDKYIDSGAVKVFYYMFSYVGERNWVRWHDNVTTLDGTAHADEIGYLFDVSLWKDTPTTEDQLIIDRITTLWANFVKFEDPTPTINELLPVKWEPVTSKSTHYYLNIDSEMTVKKRPYKERMAFWDLFYKSYKKFEKGYKEN